MILHVLCPILLTRIIDARIIDAHIINAPSTSRIINALYACNL